MVGAGAEEQQGEQCEQASHAFILAQKTRRAGRKCVEDEERIYIKVCRKNADEVIIEI